MKALVALLGLIVSAFSTVEAAPFADAAVKTPPMVVALTQALTFADRVNPSRHLILERAGTVQRIGSDRVTNLANIDGILIVVQRRIWNRPDTLAALHYFRADAAFRAYASLGINRGAYLDPSTANLGFTASSQTRRLFGIMAEMGAAWRVTPHLEMAANVHWFGSSKVGRLMRTDSGLINADPVALTLSVAWRCN